MSRKRIYWMVMLIATLWVSACNSHTEQPTDPARLIENGKPLYAQHCASCHQADGAGQPAKIPRLAGNPIVTLEDPIPVINIVVYGKGSMPAFGDQLQGDQIASILSYIRNAWGNKAVAVDQRQIP